MASAVEMAVSRDRLFATIRRIRNQWRLKLVLSGLTIVLGAALLALLVGPWVMERYRFDPPVVTGVRIATYVVLALLAVRYLVLPLLRRVSETQVALYLEEHEPSLDAMVLSAVESAAQEAPESVRSPHLVARLVERAVARTRAIGGGAGIETRSVTFSVAALAGIVAAGLLAVAWGPGYVRTGAHLMAAPWTSAAAARPYFIDVEPGNAEVARGGAQVIRARLHGFGADATELVLQRGTDSAWTHLPMAAAGDSGAFQLRLFDLVARTAYYVESNGVRSPVYHLDVLDLPYVRTLALEYHYPAYTGLANETVEHGGDIAAPRGTSVIVHAATTMPVRGGRIVVEGQPPIPMTLGADGTLTGAMRITTNGFYRIELQMSTGRVVPGSLDYVIDVLDDQAPTVAFLEPGRDTRATSVEEVFAQVEATDDYGLSAVELRYSVNGGPERNVRLHGGGTRRTEVVAGHTFFLEELGLKPGDLVSYYARAVDNDSASGGTVAKTDIYFMTIRPFEQEYRQAQQAPQQGQSGGDEGAGGLSQRQRDIIAATFKVDRDGTRMSADELRENFATLLLSQGKLHQDVELLVRRLVERGIVQSDSSFRTVAEELPKAASEMQSAESQLGTRHQHEALGPEQRALQHLQRAEEAYREIQVQFGGGGGGGAGGSQANAEDLADLFELQQDQLRNQYETESHGSPRSADQVVDETAEKLKQLAARQQREAERLRMRGAASQQSASSGGGAQRQLAEETEQAARQLERLSRERPGDRELRESARRLRDAANAMRRAAAGAGAGASDAGAAQAASAVQRLNEARRLLDQNRQGRGARDAGDVADRAQRIAREQQEIQRELQQLGAGGAAGSAQRTQRLMERKDTLAGEIDELQSRLDRLARESRREQPEAGRKLQAASDEIRRGRLSDQVRYSKGLVQSGASQYARAFEEHLSQETDSLRQQVADAADALRRANREQRRADRTLEQTRDLVRGVQSLGDRVAEARGQGGGGAEGVRQLSREYGERLRDAESLRRELRGQGVDTGELDRAIQRMRSLAAPGTYEDRAELEQLQSSVLEGLKAFEFALRRRMDAGDASRPVLGASAQVPEEFKALVEEYYRSLGKSKQP